MYDILRQFNAVNSGKQKKRIKMNTFDKETFASYKKIELSLEEKKCDLSPSQNIY